MTLRTIIVDDEELARRGLELRLAGEADIDICARCRNGREAVAAVRELQPDLLFLDIQMPGMDGFDTLRALAGGAMPMVVFVTAFAEHAIAAFEANALDYLLKPIDDRRLRAALQRVRSHAAARDADDHRERLLRLICDMTGRELSLAEALQGQPGAPRRLAIRDGQRTLCLEPEAIDWIESAGDYLCIHARGETHVVRGTLKRMATLLGDGRLDDRFARVHRSTIVNLDRVRAMRSHINGEYFLELDCDKEVKVSRSYRESVQRIALEP